MYVKLFRSILNSTVWMEDDHVIRVWLTFLLLVDSDGILKISIPGLAKEARVSIERCRSALEILEAPDPDSQSSEEEGRRILRIGGDEPVWFVVNYKHYRGIKDSDFRREYMREYMKDYRKRQAKESAAIECKHSLTHVNPGKPSLAQGEVDENIEAIDSAKALSSPSDDDGPQFSDWWDRYPKKVKRKDAERAFNKLTEAGKTAASGAGYAAWLYKWQVEGTEKRFIPNPATWLRAEQWKDEDVRPDCRSPGVDMYVGAGSDHCPYPEPER